MRKYTATAVVNVAAGALLGLTAKQAADRSHVLKRVHVDAKTGDGTFEVIGPVQFKAGEQFSTDIEPGKAMRELLAPADAGSGSKKA